MLSNRIIASVEIGTSKVAVLVGEIINGSALNIIGMGETTSAGVRKGRIYDLRAASDCTHAAIDAAEKNAGEKIEGIYLAITGSHLQGFGNRGLVTVASSDNIVEASDVRRAAESAKSKALQPGRVYIHHVKAGDFLDGERVDNAVGMEGEQLESAYWHIHGDEAQVTTHIRAINGIGLEVEDLVVSSLASGCMAATEEEKQGGVCVIDMGGGTTDYLLYRLGVVQRTGVIAVGGDHITNDLSIGLRINSKDAESLKCRYGKAIVDPRDKHEFEMLHGDMEIGDRPIPRGAIYKIINARVKETFHILQNRLGSGLSSQNLPGGIILTGGTARMPGMRELAEEVFGLPVRIATHPKWVSNEQLRDPQYSTLLGVLYFGLSAQRIDEAPRRGRSQGWLSKVSRIFK